MGIGQNLQNLVSTEALGFASVIIIIFGIKFWLSKETGKVIASGILLAICLTFIADPAMIMNFLTGIVKKVLGG